MGWGGWGACSLGDAGAAGSAVTSHQLVRTDSAQVQVRRPPGAGSGGGPGVGAGGGVGVGVHSLGSHVSCGDNVVEQQPGAPAELSGRNGAFPSFAGALQLLRMIDSN